MTRLDQIEFEADLTCPFCAIVRGADKTAELVCDGSDWLAFFPHEPATPGHTLVIPRRHVPNLWVANDELARSLMSAVLKVGRAISEVVQPDGMNLITSAGAAAEQTVYHLHLHVVPRWVRDPIDPIWPPKKRMTEQILENLAEELRSACSRL